MKLYIEEKLDNSVNLKNIAEKTEGYSGAELEQLVNEAKIQAALRKKVQGSE